MPDFLKTSGISVQQTRKTVFAATRRTQFCAIQAALSAA
jgi:hypothetical protein